MGKSSKPPKVEGLSDNQVRRAISTFDNLITGTKRQSRKANRQLKKQQRIISRSGREQNELIRQQISLEQEQRAEQERAFAEQESLLDVQSQVRQQQEGVITAFNRKQSNQASAALDKQRRSKQFQLSELLNLSQRRLT